MINSIYTWLILLTIYLFLFWAMYRAIKNEIEDKDKLNEKGGKT